MKGTSCYETSLVSTKKEKNLYNYYQKGAALALCFLTHNVSAMQAHNFNYPFNNALSTHSYIS